MISNYYFKFLTEPASDNVIGWIFFLILWICILALISLIVYGVLYIINYSFVPLKDGYGVVYEMHFEPSHYSTTLMYNAATKTATPVTHYHPDAWKLIIEKDGLTNDYYVSAEFYVKCKVGKSVYIKYKNGRLWRSLVIKKVLLQSL